ncbi:UTRA domain-containing protein, partial [Streptomyces sp. NPDC127084]|uniref:UTRA domain-containing protein n=1 Tax=Streptomyces sp. NPDC127084 TaxID=3347133 RepID=UPI003654BBE3
EVAAVLGSAGEVVVRARQMFDGERLIQLATTFVPADVAQASGIEQVNTGVGGIISRMRDAGFEQTEATEDVELRSASSSEADALGLDAGTPVLSITHIGRTAEGRVVEVTQHVLSGSWKLRYSTPLI